MTSTDGEERGEGKVTYQGGFAASFLSSTLRQTPCWVCGPLAFPTNPQGERTRREQACRGGLSESAWAGKEEAPSSRPCSAAPSRQPPAPGLLSGPFVPLLTPLLHSSEQPHHLLEEETAAVTWRLRAAIGL